MPWLYIGIATACGLVPAVLLCLWTVRRFGHREPYASFLRLRNRRKLTFFRLLLQDERIPLYIKVLPLLVVVYLISPLDILPGIPLDDLALALLALVLVVKFTPRGVLEDLLVQAAAADAPDSPTDAMPAQSPNGACER